MTSSLKTISVRRRGGGQTRSSALTQTESAPAGARAAAPDNFSCWRPLAERGGGGSFRRSLHGRANSTARARLLRTVCGSEFQTAGAEHRKARFANTPKYA